MMQFYKYFQFFYKKKLHQRLVFFLFFWEGGVGWGGVEKPAREREG